MCNVSGTMIEACRPSRTRALITMHTGDTCRLGHQAARVTVVTDLVQLDQSESGLI
jgi:hypothetical protein